MIAACLKWSAATGGWSAADQAALELGLQHAERTGTDCVAVTVGPAAAAGALGEALACGASRAVHVVVDGDLPSWDTAVALSAAVAEAITVWCGDYSADRGSGSVPAYLAALRHCEQALGVVEARPGSLPFEVLRRLDGGRRERVSVTGPAVVSVEGAAARLRRASLRAQLADHSARLTTVAGPPADHLDAPVVAYRPRARQLPAPAGAVALDRIGAILHSGTPARRGETVELEPPAAAAAILDALTRWGYRAGGAAPGGATS